MSATPEGTIIQIDQAHGMNKALVKMVGHIVEKTDHPEEKILGISHCNCPDRAQIVKEALEERMNVRDIFVVDTAGNQLDVCQRRGHHRGRIKGAQARGRSGRQKKSVRKRGCKKRNYVV